MKQVIKDFIEMMEKERKQAGEIANDVKNTLDIRLYWDTRYDALNDIIEGDEYEALKTFLVTERKVLPFQYKKQTLLEFMDTKERYKGEALTKEQQYRREIYENITEWMELNESNN